MITIRVWDQYNNQQAADGKKKWVEWIVANGVPQKSANFEGVVLDKNRNKHNNQQRNSLCRYNIGVECVQGGKLRSWSCEMGVLLANGCFFLYNSIN